MNIHDLRKELKMWGRFWAEKKALQGYASKSVTARCCEVLQTGIWASSDKHLFNHQADNIHVPWYIARIDRAITNLPVPQQSVINKRYVRQKLLSSSEKIALLHAETNVLSECFTSC
ncbi:hypothetical protein [Rheinheimera sp.]|uniref:hypothetical protein n=1 Tax=Rheinheimera sp. TaxID=1869214 RepID=UPI002735F27D|nr:hypothetical protein [Rheinheimera sp.]MDP2715524.1 hypothetical protein [Rheinheimera sp.]